MHACNKMTARFTFHRKTKLRVCISRGLICGFIFLSSLKYFNVFSFEVVLLLGAMFKRTKTDHEYDCLIQWLEGDETNPCPWELRVTVSSSRLKPMIREEDRPCSSPIASSWDDKRSSFQWSPNGDFICSFFLLLCFIVSLSYSTATWFMACALRTWAINQREKTRTVTHCTDWENKVSKRYLFAPHASPIWSPSAFSRSLCQLHELDVLSCDWRIWMSASLMIGRAIALV